MENNNLEKIKHLLQVKHIEWLEKVENLRAKFSEANGEEQKIKVPGLCNYQNRLSEKLLEHLTTATEQLDQYFDQHQSLADNLQDKTVSFLSSISSQLERVDGIENEHLRNRAKATLNSNIERFFEQYVNALAV